MPRLSETELDGRFDVVLALGLFDYLPEPQRFAERMFDLCAEGGCTVARSPPGRWSRGRSRKVRYEWIGDCPIFNYSRARLDLALPRRRFRHAWRSGPRGAAASWYGPTDSDTLMAMLVLGADWATISSLATAGGTLVLAVATFASVRSANRSARVSELALQEQRRPVLAPSRFDDPVQKIMFVEGHWVRAEGGRAVAEHADGHVYLAISLRNVGAGIGVCQGWAVRGGLLSSRSAPAHIAEEDFHPQTRDLYIPAGDIGMWQGAIRDHQDPAYPSVAAAIDARESITLELLYSDQVGEQRTITRFGLTPVGDEDVWIASVSRHWFLDRPGPRSESEVQAAAERILRTIDAAQVESAQVEAGAAPRPREEARD